jgi:hypothetical protein
MAASTAATRLKATTFDLVGLCVASPGAQWLFWMLAFFFSVVVVAAERTLHVCRSRPRSGAAEE